MSTRTTYYTSLDGLRGITALAVFLHHLGTEIGSPFADRNHMAVELLFLLSGFVIGLAYEERLKSGMSAATFLRLRVIRLYPLIIFGIAVGLVAWSLGLIPTNHIIIVLLCQLLMIPQLWQGGLLYMLNLPQWSLLYEFLANVVHVLFLKWLSWRILVGIVIVNFALLVLEAKQGGSLDGGWARFNLSVGISRTAFSYFMGLLLYRAVSSGRFRGWRSHWLLILGAALFLIPGGMRLIVGGWATDIATLIMLVALVATTVATPLPARLEPAARLMGEVSYPLYTVHFPLLLIVKAFVTAYALSGWRADLVWASSVLLIPIFAFAASRYYDIPVRHFLTSRNARSTRTVQITTAP